MNDDDFEPRLGRTRAAGSHRGKSYLHRVIRAASRAGGMPGSGRKRFVGSRTGRGNAVARMLASRVSLASLRMRRTVVKTRIVRLGGKGAAAARAHLRYIQRDAAAGEGREAGLYSAHEDVADAKDFHERCQGDRHQFRFIVSAEDGAEYGDLRPLIRRLMSRMEDDLGTSLDWVAADHHDTGHPHTHIVLRGKDERGENLVIAPEYVSHGMRERLAEIVALDLGPRTDLEIERVRRRDIDQERLTFTDRRLLRAADGGRELGVRARDSMDRAILTGRLRKLERLGLAEALGGERWRLSNELEGSLRALGERGDIIRTMRRAFAAEARERGPASLAIHDPACDGPIVGRLVERGLDDETRDRHYLIVDGADGRSHYVRAGNADAVDVLPANAIVRVTPNGSGVREVDRTIAAIAAANHGFYSLELHARRDPSASVEYIASHVRRLEAIRRATGLIDTTLGIWRLGAEHLATVARFAERQSRSSPVEVEILSALPLDRLPHSPAETWLDRELASDDPVPLHDAGFGRAARTALTARRAWLIANGLAADRDGALEFATGARAQLRRAEWNRTTAALAQSLGKDFVEANSGATLSGKVVRPVDLAAGRFALIEGEREFALVPWRRVLSRAIGREVSGRVGTGGISWTIGRSRGLER